jgi:hypothetical protein
MMKIYMLAIALFFLASCKDTVTNNGNNGNTIVFPDSNVSFRKHVLPLFHQRCNTNGCHNQRYPDRDFDLATYGGFMIAPRVIVYEGSPDNSPLILSVEGTNPTSSRMPLNKPPLTNNQIRGLRIWIFEGALNN